MKAILFKEDLKPYLIEMPEPWILKIIDNGNYQKDIIEAKVNAIPFDESCIDEVTELAVSTIEANKNPFIEIGILPDTIYEVPGLDDMVEVKPGKFVDDIEYPFGVIEEKFAFLKKQEESQEDLRIKESIMDFSKKVSEFLLDPLFNLEHSKHSIACERLAQLRNEFIKKSSQ